MINLVRNFCDMLNSLCVSELKSEEIFVKNMVYKFYIKNPGYEICEEALFKYIGYGYNYHIFDVVDTSLVINNRRFKYDILIKVYGNKENIHGISNNHVEILKIIPAPEYAL